MSQLGDMDDTMITNLEGQEQTVPQFLDERFGWSYSMMWPIVPILIAFVAAFSAVAIFALYRINYQRR